MGDAQLRVGWETGASAWRLAVVVSSVAAGKHHVLRKLLFTHLPSAVTGNHCTLIEPMRLFC